jgi:hypothetical protein
MTDLISTAHDWSFDWLRTPILQPDTRLAFMANPRTGRMIVQGWENTGPATAVLDVMLDS